ncbi:hypothetical protein [Neptuniibacter sp. QD37_11]
MSVVLQKPSDVSQVVNTLEQIFAERYRVYPDECMDLKQRSLMY